MHQNRNLKLFSSLLLLPVLIPLLFIVSNDVNKWRIKRQSRARLEKSVSLIQVRIHRDEVKWMDKKEVLVNGRMFDYKSSSLNNGWYTFTGHYDDKEAKLLRKQQQAQEQKAGQQTLIRLFKSLHQLYHQSHETPPVPASLVYCFTNLRNTAILLTPQEVSTPPPRQHGLRSV